MSDRKATSFNDEVRDTVVKSGLTGVAATILAVAVCSPAGLGGLIGTSVAFGSGASNTAGDPYARLPAFPSPLTHEEVDAIQVELAQTSASLELTRAATDERIEHVRSLAVTGDLVTFAPTSRTYAATQTEDLRLMSTDDLRHAASTSPVTSPRAALVNVAYDPNAELAELLLTHEMY